MKPTAINKLTEWLKNELMLYKSASQSAIETAEDRDIYDGQVVAVQDILDKALSLAKEEQAEQAQTPKPPCKVDPSFNCDDLMGKPADNRERLAHCPTCTGGIKLTERRPDGDSICVMGHKHKTSAFFHYYPSSNKGNDKGLYKAISELANCRGRRVSTKELRDTLDKFREAK